MFAAGAEGPGGPRRIRHYKKKNTERRHRTDRQVEGETVSLCRWLIFVIYLAANVLFPSLKYNIS